MLRLVVIALYIVLAFKMKNNSGWLLHAITTLKNSLSVWAFTLLVERFHHDNTVRSIVTVRFTAPTNELWMKVA